MKIKSKQTRTSSTLHPRSPARRRFVAGGVSSLFLVGCSEQIAPGRYTQADIDLLAEQQLAEQDNAGKGPYGEHVYRGYRGLAELPWFELDQQGRLHCVDDSIPMSIDAHCHLGMSVLFKPKLDLNAPAERVKHLLDCDEQQPGCRLDLDVYANGNFTEQSLDTLEHNIMAQGLWGSAMAETQTIPNLLREMDAMRVQRSLILPIKLGLPFGDDQTEVWRAAIDSANAAERLLAGFSVHPNDDDKIEQLRQHAKRGFKVMKLHPTVQRFFPDDESMMELYEVAQQLGVVIFFHGGRAGIEPDAAQPYAMPRHYEAAFSNFPKLNFIIGHAGARDFDAMFALARRYQNTWVGTHGQSLTNLETMINQSGGERLLFGTDWPFYHIANSLAKVLITTQKPQRASIRHALLRGNAEDLFSLN